MSEQNPTNQSAATQAPLHTPGPWRVHTLDLPAKRHIFVIKDEVTSLLEMNGPCHFYNNAEADAHLIAAAPDLLAAAKIAADASLMNSDWPGIEQLKGAIAKAEGRPYRVGRQERERAK